MNNFNSISNQKKTRKPLPKMKSMTNSSAQLRGGSATVQTITTCAKTLDGAGCATALCPSKRC